MSELDETFRCEAFACVLSKKACLRRQTETRAGRSKGRFKVVTTRWQKPLHPHCASGECSQGNAIAAAFAGQPLPPMHDPRAAPRLDLVNQEPAMSKTVCAECKSPSKHASGCSKPEKRIPAPPARPAAAKPAPEPRAARPARRAPTSGPEAMTVDELVELRDRIDAELASRLDRLEADRKTISDALAARKPADLARAG